MPAGQTTSLRARLMLALVVPLGIGCKERPAPTDAGAPAKPVTTWVDTSERDLQDPLATRRSGGCPRGNACVPQSMVAAYAASTAAALACPSVLAADKLADAGAPTGAAHARVTLDVAATQARRDAGDATTCCYAWLEPCPGGRPLFVAGLPVIASVVGSREWT